MATASSTTTCCAAAVALGLIASVTILPTVSYLHGDSVDSRASDKPLPTTLGRQNDGSDTQLEAAIARADDNSAESVLRRQIRLAPNDDGLREQLVELSDHRTPPRDSDAYRSARSLLPPRFIEHQTRRFLVLSDADTYWTRLQIERLERAHHQFMRFAKQLDLDPLPLRHKLICVLFQNHEDYVEFAAKHDGVNARWISGYYALRNDRIVFYNVESGANVNEARDLIAEMEAEIGSIRRQAADARRSGDRRMTEQLDEHLRRYDRHLREQRRRLDRFTADTIVATTIHEAVHQLSFHTMIQHPHVHYPLWISEGLATAFETNAPNQSFGPDHRHAGRHEKFVQHYREDRLLPLRELVSITDPESLTGETVSVLYHQSYALVTWLYRFRRDELREYLRLMRAAPQRPLSTHRHAEFFEAAFGDIDRLEQAWLNHEHGR